MKVYGGIDLGSTTTKCVLLDEEGGNVGRGITNTRANYDVACEVAVSEARLDARLRLFERYLPRGNPGRSNGANGSGALLAAVTRALRMAHYQSNLAQLEAEIADALREKRYEGRAAELSGTVGEILDELRRRAEDQFKPGAEQVSDFFRDVAGSQYLELAEATSRPGLIEFETLMGLFDKSILRVENRVSDFSFESAARPALVQALGEIDLPARIEWVERASAALDQVLATELELVATVGTGYGRQRLPFPKEWIRSEILCHGLGAHSFFPKTATVLDIGGQDTKAIQIDETGIVKSFQMNDRCAAGCGRFLGYIADELNLGLHALGPLALSARRALPINSTCTVFAGAELRDRLAAGERREEILAGLHRAIVLRAMSLVARAGGVREEFTFTGGVAKNAAVVHYVKEILRESYGVESINISPESIYTGAVGAALFARRAAQGETAA